MKMPSAISTWFMILYFLFAGLGRIRCPAAASMLRGPNGHLCPRRSRSPFFLAANPK